MDVTCSTGMSACSTGMSTCSTGMSTCSAGMSTCSTGMSTIHDVTYLLISFMSICVSASSDRMGSSLLPTPLY